MPNKTNPVKIFIRTYIVLGLLIGLGQHACTRTFAPPKSTNSVREYRLWNRDFESLTKWTGNSPAASSVLTLTARWICWGPDHAAYLFSGEATVRSYLLAGMHERPLTTEELAARNRPSPSFDSMNR